MNRLIEEFKLARKNLLSDINQFPEDKREAVLFDKWSLKDILIHLTGWSVHQLTTLKDFRAGKKPLTPPENLKAAINDDLVAKQRQTVWNKVYDKFTKTSGQLIAQYKSLSQEFWDKKIWKDKDISPKEFIRIEINHYKKTHGPQIKRVLKQFVG